MRSTEVRYSCVACGAKDRRVSVRIRNPRESFHDWVKGPVQLAMLGDHGMRSRNCMGSSLTGVFPEDLGRGEKAPSGPLKYPLRHPRPSS